jgi:DNA polymerase III epsilon subunit-like protein
MYLNNEIVSVYLKRISSFVLEYIVEPHNVNLDIDFLPQHSNRYHSDYCICTFLESRFYTFNHSDL